MKLAIPDLISNSYFPALAAAELGFFEREGIEVSAELIFPVDRAYEALREGAVDFVGGAAHGALAAFSEWRGLLSAAGLDPHRNDIRIGPVPGATGSSVNFGLTAAKALEAGAIDGFWANGMAAELAVTTGVGTIVLDVRRGDGPPGCFDYTMPVLATTDRLIERSPDTAAAALRALVGAQNALKADVSRATEVGAKRFPPRETGLIAGIVRRDLPYYDAAISERSVAAINDFARSMSVLDDDVPYADIVATQFRHL